MDPTLEELSGMRSVADICAWVGVSSALQEALFTKIGLTVPRLVRHVVAVKWSTWVDATTALEIIENDIPRGITPVEEGHVGCFRRVCRLVLGLPGDEGAPVPAPGLQPERPRPAECAVDFLRVRKLKLGNILDQADDSEIPPLPANDITALVAAWARNVNDSEPPTVEQEATGDQISTLRARLLAGMVPYADFSVWRPHGARLLRTLKFQAHYPTPGGGWRTREIAGPTSYEEWRSSWEVFAFAMEVLQAASRARLERYACHIRKLAGTYPEFWWIVAMADSRCRAEHLERVRRVSVVEHAAGRLPDFEPERPWDVVFREAAKDHAFWADNVDRPALQFATKIAGVAKLTDEGFGRVALALEDSHRNDESKQKKTRRGRGKKRARSASSSPSPPRRLRTNTKSAGKGKNADARAADGKFFRDTRGVQLCWAWNSSPSGCSKPCPSGRAHACEWCRSSQHRSCGCTRPQSANEGRGPAVQPAASLPVVQ